jgi:hypothetical protein
VSSYRLLSARRHGRWQRFTACRLGAAPGRVILVPPANSAVARECPSPLGDAADLPGRASRKGKELFYRGRPLASVEPDKDLPGKWRVRMPDGHVTDMVNLTRAKDAALSLASAALDRECSEAA